MMEIINNQDFDYQFYSEEYIKIMSSLLNLPINEEYKNGVVENFDKIKSIAKIVNDFPLPEEIDICPTFEP